MPRTAARRPNRNRESRGKGQKPERPPRRCKCSNRGGLSFFRSAPDRIRTCDLRLRRPTLYPAELRARSTGREANKPSSVPALRRRRIISLGPTSPPASCGLPGTVHDHGRARGGPPLVPVWPCSGWGLPCHRRCRRRGALLPHPFTLACARTARAIGGLLSVALSVALRRPGVTRHRALWSSDFPRRPAAPRSSLASLPRLSNMPRRGLEPPRRLRHQILSLACLPVSAPGHPQLRHPCRGQCSREDSNLHGLAPTRS